MSVRSGRNKFSDRELKRIKEMLSIGVSTADIAKRLNCSVNPIRTIKKGLK